MANNGIFRKKTGFTITGNSVARDKNLSFKAKGLYLLIMSYITCDSINLTKSFLLRNSLEGDKAFDAAWTELKVKGYLKLYCTQGSGGRWIYEYDLLPEPELGLHTFYLNSKGEIVNNNESLKEKRNSNKNNSISPHPQKGGCGDSQDRTPPFGGSGNGCSGKGGYNINTIDNTIDMNSFHSFIADEGRNKKQSDENDSDLFKLPYISPEMADTIHILTKWQDYSVNGYPDKKPGADSAYILFNDAIIDMCCNQIPVNLKGSLVTYSKVIDKINLLLTRGKQSKEEGIVAFQTFQKVVISKYLDAITSRTVKDYNKYMKACIWEGLTTGGLINLPKTKKSENSDRNPIPVAKPNQFHNFNQRDTDYNGLVMQKLKERMGIEPSGS